MVSRRHIGPIAIVLLVALNALLWWIYPPLDHGRSASFPRQAASEFIAATMTILFACALLLATRWRLLEPWFGGLDRMYLWHRNSALTGFVLAIVHFVLTPLDTANVKPGTPMGLIAFFGIAILLLLTIAPRLPGLRWILGLSYGSWRITHKLIGFFFFIGFVHMMLVDPLVRTTPIPFAIVCAVFGIGLASWLYALFIARFARPSRRYRVEATARPGPDSTEVVLSPLGKPIAYRAGQSVFIRFKGDWRLGEPHPFTVSSSPREQMLRLTIKASGDFTGRIQERLKPGMVAVVEGSYGYFDYRQGGEKQIWIAAGVGITPFLSWLRDLDAPLERDVHLFYAVRNREDALYLDELNALAAEHPRLRFHLNISSRDGSLTLGKIAGTVDALAACHVYMCGPPGLTGAFAAGFRAAGIRARHIHFELFNFR